jgi:UDP-glucose 4-epimerase
VAAQRNRPVVWVVGASGLLGSAVTEAVRRTGAELIVSRIPWSEPDAAVEALLETAGRLPAAGWRVLWCAGSGVVASSAAHFDAELAVLGGFLDRWNPGAGADRAVFFASSAGAVFAGSGTAPFTEETTPVPISPYGHAKLRAEGLFAAFAESRGVPVLIGRLSNLYGPGQDLSKGQGLVSLLCSASLTGAPLDVYVSLDTIRDYLFTDDAAAMALAGADLVASRPGAHVKVLASGQSLSIGGVIGEVRHVTRRRPPIVAGFSAVTKLQTADLRMHSVVWPPLQQYARTPFSVGIASCLAAVEASLRCPQKDGA